MAECNAILCGADERREGTVSEQDNYTNDIDSLAIEHEEVAEPTSGEPPQLVSGKVMAEHLRIIANALEDPEKGFAAKITLKIGAMERGEG